MDYTVTIELDIEALNMVTAGRIAVWLVERVNAQYTIDARVAAVRRADDVAEDDAA